MKRDKPVDIVFVLDATSSMQYVFTGLIEHIQGIVEELEFSHRRALFYYGAVIFRDPIAYKPDPPSPNATEEDLRLIDELRIKDLKEHNRYDEENEERKRRLKALFDHIKYPENINVAIDLVSNLDKLINEISKVDCKSGNDDPEDWAGALDMALNVISWRNNSKKLIIWLSDSNAHGERFSGKPEYKSEEAKLEQLVKQMAESNIYFRAINIMKGSDLGCKKTLKQIEQIYNENGGKNFAVEDLHVVIDPTLDEYDIPPGFLSDFGATISVTIRNIPGALFD